MSALQVINNNGLGAGFAPSLSSEEFKYFCDRIQQLVGISMKPTKLELLQSRLRSRLVEGQFDNFQAYRSYLESLPENHKEWQNFINLLTTNKTDFFRETKHFDYLVQKILPEWAGRPQREFKIWSAASSTGEEAYTLSMVLNRHFPKGKTFEIFASDIDTEVLSTAQNAVYSNSKLHEIPTEFQSQSIDIGRLQAEGWFRIKPDIKKYVSFMQHNLIDTQPPASAPFDLIFCRNVLIYFNKEIIALIAQKMQSCLRPNGYFVIGHAESLQGLRHPFNTCGPSVFKAKS